MAGLHLVSSVILSVREDGLFLRRVSFGVEAILGGIDEGDEGRSVVVIRCLLIVVLVEGAEVGGIELDAIIDAVAESQTDAIGVDVERNIVHECVFVGVEGALHTGADFPLLGEVVFYTGEEFLCAVVEQIVFVSSFDAGLGLFVEIIMVAEIEAERFEGTHLKTEREEGGNVAAYLCVVGKLSKLCVALGVLAVLGIVGERDAGAEFVFGGYVDIAAVEVCADDGGKSYAVLMHVDVHVARGFGECARNGGELTGALRFGSIALGVVGQRLRFGGFLCGKGGIACGLCCESGLTGFNGLLLLGSGEGGE